MIALAFNPEPTKTEPHYAPADDRPDSVSMAGWAKDQRKFQARLMRALKAIRLPSDGRSAATQ